MQPQPDNPGGLGLELADGSGWVLTGDTETAGWLAELAHITGLQPLGRQPTHRIHLHAVAELADPRRPPSFLRRGDDTQWSCFKNAGIQRVWRHPHRSEIHVELRKAFLDHPEIRYINMWSVLRELHRHALAHGGTPVHATLAALDGKGVLIAAASGTGKSTCYARLPAHWERLCDDQALILAAADGHFRVHPFPTWSDYLWRQSTQQWPVGRSVPLTAAFFLEQAPTDEVLPFNDLFAPVLRYLEAAKQVWKPLWSRVGREEERAQSSLLFESVTRLARTVPAYRLRATLNGEFWKEMEKLF